MVGLFRRYDVVKRFHVQIFGDTSWNQGPFIQNVGTPRDNGFMHTTFSKDGSKYLVIDRRGLIEVYDFSRCIGLFTM
ncbi:MAG: hypothetical protein IPP71_09220 [Bacteroidetes bacterium]|nr:hypothetical protein [Bacteroidota bacterium]